MVKTMAFEDHHAYRPEDLDFLVAEAKSAGAGRLVTTEKDAVKIRPEWRRGFPVEVFRVEPDFLGAEDEFLDLVEKTIGETGEAA